jgi:hypothetical protein
MCSPLVRVFSMAPSGGPLAASARFSHFANLLEAEDDEEAPARLSKGERVGRPVGSDAFLAAPEATPPPPRARTWIQAEGAR